MPLTALQINILDTAIGAYAFPATYYDFAANAPVHAVNMAVVEVAIRRMLTSANPTDAKYGLANVLYWGYAQIGFGPTRVNRFLENVTPAQIIGYQALVIAHPVPNLTQLRSLRMPQYSGISFLSKVLTFLDPAQYCVLDLQLAKLPNGFGARALHELVSSTTIPVTQTNQVVYNLWRAECVDISNTYFNGRYRAVDVERGFFHLIQTGNLAVAQQIYAFA
ncbi:hypothetical protein HNQ50_003031 [Silvimonas terrae]|uniref:Uncharacterized protein n=1 Tax=Silvimonas terrae TaxID=300266 RepID=A0A840RIK9_9NEIS|nr:hypothetical protein [Silvimonas terrae]MBB5192290.1 hypothetical protein [Silvimonas terrae]